MFILLADTWQHTLPCLHYKTSLPTPTIKRHLGAEHRGTAYPNAWNKHWHLLEKEYSTPRLQWCPYKSKKWPLTPNEAGKLWKSCCDSMRDNQSGPGTVLWEHPYCVKKELSSLSGYANHSSRQPACWERVSQTFWGGLSRPDCKSPPAQGGRKVPCTHS